MPSYVKGSTSNTIPVLVCSTASATQAGLISVAHTDFSAWYKLGKTGAMTAITLASGTAGGAWGSGKWAEESATNAPGFYTLDMPDAAFDTNETWGCLILKGATNMPSPLIVEFQILPGVTVQSDGGIDVGSINGVTITGNGADGNEFDV